LPPQLVTSQRHHHQIHQHRKASSSSGSSPVGSNRSVVFEDQDPFLQTQLKAGHHHHQRTYSDRAPLVPPPLQQHRPSISSAGKGRPLNNTRLIGNQISSNSTSEIPHVHHLAKDSRQFSNSTVSLTSRAPSDTPSRTPSTASAPPMTTNNKSGWQKLFSAFKKNKGGKDGSGGGAGASTEAFCVKHSHNCSNSFLRAGISNMKGYKKSNQDRCTAFSYLEGDPELAYFAVYDGHGGTGVANYLKDHCHEFILDQPEYKEGNIEESVLKAFLQVDEELRTYGSATELTGSTATVILIKHGDLICANLGDSRAVASLQGLVKNLSTDHNTSNAQERERIFSMGGTIKDNRVGGVLIPTRSFGDFLLKSETDKPPWKQVISAVPQLQTFHLDCQWEFVVVGSDGVWDAMSNDAMVAYVRQRLSSHSAQRDKLVLSQLCEQILDMCCAKTVGRYGKNSCDNMTIIIIWFDHDTNKSDTSSSVVSSCVSR